MNAKFYFQLLPGFYIYNQTEMSFLPATFDSSLTTEVTDVIVRSDFHYTTNATTTTQKQSDYRV